MNDLAKAREKVEALACIGGCVNKAEVLAILGKEKRYIRLSHDYLRGGVTKYVSNERKGQRRVKIQRYYDDILQGHGLEAPTYGRRIGKERRHE